MLFQYFLPNSFSQIFQSVKQHIKQANTIGLVCFSIARLLSFVAFYAPLISSIGLVNEVAANEINPKLLTEFDRLKQKAIVGSLLSVDNFLAVHQGDFAISAGDLLVTNKDINLQLIPPLKFSELLAVSAEELEFSELEDDFVQLYESYEPVTLTLSIDFLSSLLVNEAMINDSALAKVSAASELEINSASSQEILHFDSGRDFIAVALNSFDQVAAKPSLPKNFAAYDTDIMQDYAPIINRALQNLEDYYGFTPNEWSLMPLPSAISSKLEELIVVIYQHGLLSTEILQTGLISCPVDKLEAIGNDRSQPGFNFACKLSIFGAYIGYLQGEVFFIKRNPSHFRLEALLEDEVLIQINTSEQGFAIAAAVMDSGNPGFKAIAELGAEDSLGIQLISTYEQQQELIGSYTLSHTLERFKLATGPLTNLMLRLNEPFILDYEIARESPESQIWEGSYTMQIPDYYGLTLQSKLRVVDTPEWLWSTIDFSGNMFQDEFLSASMRISGQIESKSEIASGGIIKAKGRENALPFELPRPLRDP